MVISSASMPSRRRLRAVTLLALAYLGACSLGVSPEDDYFTSTQNSCAGHCGSDVAVPGSDPECFCDDVCVDSGDCCSDFSAVCAVDGAAGSSGDGASGSCVGFCGELDPVPGAECYCDVDCTANGDCCADYAAACTADGGD